MLLNLLNISKSYDTVSGHGLHVLSELSMHLDAGETMAVLGPSGSGKSTLLNIIGALDRPDSGEVFFNDEKINSYTEDQLASFRNREIGFVFQSHHLLPQFTVLENVLIPTLTSKDKTFRKSARDRAETLIKEVGLWDHKDNYPGTLSGGECQRVAVVRALINKPKLLLADEPTGSLDRSNALAITALLLQLNEESKTSLIVVTHSEEISKHLGKIFKLVDGKLQQVK